MTSVGELLWDVYDTDERLGGSSANVAFHAARWGAESTLVSRVGRDERGQRALALLEAAGVRTTAVQVDSTRPTGTVRVRLVDGEPEFSIGLQAAWDHLSFPPQVQRLLTSSGALCLSPLAGRTPLASRRMRDALYQLAHQARRPSVLVDLNLRPPHTTLDVAWSLLRAADFVKLNEQELATVERSVGTGHGLRTLLHEFSLTAVCVTRGARGASLYGHGVSLHQPVSARTRAALRGKEEDPVGAGDSFVAVFAHALARQPRREFWRSAAHTLARAVDYAAWVAHSRGAMPGLPRSRSP